MDAKHTPGPWAYRQDDTGEDGFVVVSEGRPYVATVHSGARDWTESNARLIAAAPDLLEALTLADTMLSGANMNAKVVTLKVRAAIAKATGAAQ